MTVANPEVIQTEVVCLFNVKGVEKCFKMINEKFKAQ